MHLALAVSIALAACSACTAPVAPRVYVRVTLTQPGVPQDYADAIDRAADAWSEFGVVSGDADVVCAPQWWLAIDVCVIPVSVTFWPKSQIGDLAGLTSNRDTQLAQELMGTALESVAAHEFGHSIWDSADHLLSGEVGIMSAASSGAIVPTDADSRYVRKHTNL